MRDSSEAPLLPAAASRVNYGDIHWVDADESIGAISGSPHPHVVVQAAYSGQSGHLIRFNPARHSGPKRPLIPVHFGQSVPLGGKALCARVRSVKKSYAVELSGTVAPSFRNDPPVRVMRCA
jgi:mRNA-degrading endonuclease toxin of MazEF toxin-antitoxin module